MSETSGADSPYLLHAWEGYRLTTRSFATLGEALDLATDECLPLWVITPSGERISAFTGMPLEDVTS